MKELIHTDWQQQLKKELEAPYFKQLETFIDTEYQTHTIYPEKDRLFEALNLTPFSETQVVILGQDPYHGPNQAHGLSFSVLPGNTPPPSLKNIYKELQEDLGIIPPSHGYLEPWAKQGVLMLNTILTVRQGDPFSHKGKGWEVFTDKIIEQLNEKDTPVIYLLWGKPAQKKETLIDTNKHIVLKAPHPSPLAAYRGFFGSKPFSTINQLLIEHGKTAIDWSL